MSFWTSYKSKSLFSISRWRVKQVFNPAHFVSFRSVSTLKSHLIRANFYPVGERLAGSRKSNKNSCLVCQNVTETQTLQSFVDTKVYKINHRFRCSGKDLVYLLIRFTKSIIDLHVVTKVWSTSCHVMYVVYNITVKLLMNSDKGRTIVQMTIGKVNWKVWRSQSSRLFCSLPNSWPQWFY